MFVNLTSRTSLYILSVLLVFALLSGAAHMNHSPPLALAQFSDDAFDPSIADQHANFTVVPSTDFSADPTSGPAPLQVQFTDKSTSNPTGWAWYFGDEAFDEPWTQLTDGAQWAARDNHTSVVLADGSIVLMGGHYYSAGRFYVNDVWRSIDQGATWTQMTAAAGWRGRDGHTSVVLPDGSIVVISGHYSLGYGYIYLNDVWRSTDQGATWMQMTDAPPWTGRAGHTSVVLPDGSIVLMGGIDGPMNWRNDVWRSTDQGATWMLMTAAAPWSARTSHSSVVLPDGSIVLMGGHDGSRRNDVWRSTDQGSSWTQMTAGAPWTTRSGHTCVALPDGNIVLMGGFDTSYQRDVWRSTDQGATWTQMTAAAGWRSRVDHSSVALPDGSIVLMGGRGGYEFYLNDVWRLETAGSSEQHPMHAYTKPGTYSVALQAYNADGFSSLRKVAYINVTGTEAYLIYLPLLLR